MIHYCSDKYEIVLSVLPFMFKGLWLTFLISIIAITIGSLLGFVLGLIRTLPFRLPRNLIGLYLHLFRGSPFLVQLYIVYFVFPSLGIPLLQFDSFTAAIVSLSLYTSSYVTEVATAAIKAVPSGQEEAARSVGMSKIQALRYIVLPQSVKLAIPPMAGIYVIIIKSTAVLSVIGISELTRQGEIAILRMPNDTMFIYLLIAVMYFIYCYPVLRFSKWAEDRFGSIGVSAKD
ncbi:MAG: amino acid ABC transporter permease [Proteobacteria bacterium]|nr:MAG: amino acid ABC transporter permease [Pseudomonadota bacterium]